MNAFAQKLEDTKNDALTHKGGKTNLSSTNNVLDLFFVIGNRNKDFRAQFTHAYNEDREQALRVLLWARDVRGGAGERSTTKLILSHIEQQYPQELPALIEKWYVFGRWDDILDFKTPGAKKLAFERIKKALIVEKDGLCAKWMPRQGPLAVELRKFMNMSPKEWRKTLVEMTKVIETQMCSKDWGSINYSHVPSVASARYQKAFGRNDTERYVQYLKDLKDPSKKDTVKINASAVYPYDIVKSMRNGSIDAAIAQWDAMPNYLDGNSNILPMIDVSGSMTSSYLNSSISPMDVAVSIGTYIADKQTSAFKDLMLTFSSTPELFKLTGKNVFEKMNKMKTAHWGMSTNIEAGFGAILNFAKKYNVPKSDMPEYILVISDMEFDQATRTNDTTYKAARIAFEGAGYDLPKIVFWNVNARVGNSPVTTKDENTALVSGYSPAIMKAILSNNLSQFSPVNVMLETIMTDRYNIWA